MSGTVLGSGRRRPNVVIILADDLGYGDVSCQNDDLRVPTPHFDRLAAQGIRFTDAHSGSAVCTPTRYGLLTGRYCWRTRLTRGVLNGFSEPLIVQPKAGEPPGRLYDMAQDPQETTNLWTERPDVVADLTERLERCQA